MIATDGKPIDDPIAALIILAIVCAPLALKAWGERRYQRAAARRLWAMCHPQARGVRNDDTLGWGGRDGR